MPEIMLTEEEARHIEQRRLMENKFNLGYNEALRDVENYVYNDSNSIALLQWIDTQRKIIRP